MNIHEELQQLKAKSAQLRADVTAFEQSQAASTASQIPLPAGAPQNLTHEQQVVLSDNWAGYLLETKKPVDWTASEKEAVRASIERCLQSQG